MSREKINLTYQLSREEAYEAFYLLASRRSAMMKRIVGAVLTALAVGLLVLYGLDNRRIHFLFLALVAILLLFYILYQPVIRARRGSAQVARASGNYRITLYRDGRIGLPDGTSVSASGDKFARAVETDTIFAIRADAQHTFCIPKRILKEEDAEFVRNCVIK